MLTNLVCRNQTNLAIKGIIGLKAMSQIARLTNNVDSFGDTADRYLKGWKELAINSKASPPHTTLSYGDSDSHGNNPAILFPLLPLTCPTGLAPALKC